MNSNPALHTSCEVLREVIPGVVMETLGEAATQPPGPSNRPLCLPTLSPSSDIHKPSSPAPERLHGNPTFWLMPPPPSQGDARPHLTPTPVPPLTPPRPVNSSPGNAMPGRLGARPSLPPTPPPPKPGSPPTPPQTWHSRPSRRACAARRCCRCCPSAASCSCTTARQTCGRAWGAPAASPARRRRRPGPPATPRPPRPPLSAPPAGRARAGPRRAGAPAARPGGPPPHSGAPGLRPPAPTAPSAGTPRPRAADGREWAAGSRRGSLPRGWRRRSARTRATAAPSGRPPAPSRGPIKAALLQTRRLQLVLGFPAHRAPRPPPAASLHPVSCYSTAGAHPWEDTRVEGWGCLPGRKGR